MSATTKHKLEFAVAMSRHTHATVRQIEALMRYAITLHRIAESECNDNLPEAELAKREAKKGRIKQKVKELCAELAPVNFDVVRNRCTVSSHLSKEMAQALADSLLEEYPDDDVNTVNMGCVPVFSGDPRGCVLKIRVPDGFSDDGGREGICVPS